LPSNLPASATAKGTAPTNDQMLGALMGTKLLVSNLPLDIDSSTLEDMFTMVGNVSKAAIEIDGTTGLSRGRGYVEMSTAQEAQNCIDHFNGQSKGGNRLAVREDIPHVPKVTVMKTSLRKAFISSKKSAAKRKPKVGKREF